MKHNLPKQVRLCGHVLSVAALPRSELKAAGSLVYVDNSIKIDEDMCSNQMAATLLHEVLHGAFYIAGLQHTFKTAQEEMIVTRLEPFLFAFIRDNPKVIKYIQEA